MAVDVLYAVTLVVAFFAPFIAATRQRESEGLLIAGLGTISAASVGLYAASIGAGPLFYVALGLFILNVSLVAAAVWSVSE